MGGGRARKRDPDPAAGSMGDADHLHNFPEQEHPGDPPLSGTAVGDLRLTEKELSDCRLGYRCKYVHAAARAVEDGKIDLNSLREADDAAATDALTGLFGVGIKVASCVSLFGLHHIDSFPIDVWMKRILAEQYPEGYPFDRYSPYNGIYQQYMFAFYRHFY